jgi:hypothetical protein
VPIAVHTGKGVRWQSPGGGTCLTPGAFSKINTELVRLQIVEQQPKPVNPVNPAVWFTIGAGVATVIAVGVASVYYAATR